MKKLNLLLLAFIALFVISCNETATGETESVEVEEAVSEKATAFEMGPKVEVPAFENKDFSAFAHSMDALMDKTIDLLKVGDEEGLAALEAEGQALQAQGEALKDVVSDNDIALFENYMKDKAKQVMTAAGIDLSGIE